MEFEFSFSNGPNKTHKIFNNVYPGNTQLGDFIYHISSEISQGGQYKAVASKDIIINPKYSILRISRFSKSVIFEIKINTYYTEMNSDSDIDPVKEISLDTTGDTNEVNVKIAPLGGLVQLSKPDKILHYTKSVRLAILALNKLDENLNEQTHGVYHNIPSFESLVHKTIDF